MNNSRQSFTYYRLGQYQGLKVLLLLFVTMLIGCTSAIAQQTRTYRIAAIEVDWDYAPTGINQISGNAFGESENVFVQSGKQRIGKVYRKAVYREYTDAAFTAAKAVAPQWEHLGALGPVIRGEVGDTIQVVFKNMTSFPTSIHPHGVSYLKNSEGAPYNDGTSGADMADDAVPSGGTHTYIWQVPERAGPGPMDGSSVLWMYHAHTDEPADTNTGLVGPLIVTRKGNANPDGSPKDIDREFVTLFTVFNENASHYLEHNVNHFTGKPKKTMKNLDDPEFQESNLMHSVNGYVYGNLPGLTMQQGERVRWYVLSIGTEVDLHTPHWHGQTVLWMGSRMDMVELLPGSMKTIDMAPDNPGTWLYHCHVNDHITAGMMALFTVTE
ncbi:copper oxidase [Candidatus Methylomirabilis limnetica]|uniref:Copper oxidase n=1 Tax=Candidatus Methylomirabilis limnetica TaxID=2033718 RepID=A0A2T4TYP0_9BACT|nr:multicopper oxidase domain-containing protein [Candidatus Methylomirabilis limnetica]PTL36245.1 copper oxidase [Candidatus Methylomirabilis limnetica]